MGESAQEPALASFSQSTVRIETVTVQQLHTRGRRLDAGHHIAGLHHARLADLAWTPLGDLCGSIDYPTRFKRVYVSDGRYGTPFLSASKVLSFRPKSDALLEKATASVCRVEPGWILVSRSGTVGRCVIVGQRLSEFAVSDDLIRLIHPAVPAGYLYAYLLTEHGQRMVSRDRYGSTVKHLEPHHLKGVPIPVFSKEHQAAIDELIRDAWRIRDEANALLDKAEKELFQSLSLPAVRNDLDTDAKADHSWPRTLAAFSVPSSQFRERLDASFHLPRAQNAVEIMRRAPFPVEKLGEVAEEIDVAPRFKRVYVAAEHGVPFLQGSHVPLIRPFDLKYLSRTQTTNLARWLIRRGQVLVTCSGTIGRVGMVSSFRDGWAASQHILRISTNPTRLHPGYVAAFLMATYGQYQVLAKVYGGVVDELTENDVAQVLIPIPPEHVHRKIGEMVLEAFEQKDRAAALEDEAIAKLEKLLSGGRIEQDEPRFGRFRSLAPRLVAVPKQEVDSMKDAGD